MAAYHCGEHEPSPTFLVAPVSATNSASCSLYRMNGSAVLAHPRPINRRSCTNTIIAIRGASPVWAAMKEQAHARGPTSPHHSSADRLPDACCAPRNGLHGECRHPASLCPPDGSHDPRRFPPACGNRPAAQTDSAGRLMKSKPTSDGQEQWFEYGRIAQRGSNPPELAVVGQEAAQFGSVLSLPSFKPLPKPDGPTQPETRCISRNGGTGQRTDSSPSGIIRRRSSASRSLRSSSKMATTVQYFERGRLELDLTANNAVRITQTRRSGAWPRRSRGRSAGLAWTSDRRWRRSATSKASSRIEGHWVLVNLAQQHLWAFDGTNLVRISTSLPAFTATHADRARIR